MQQKLVPSNTGSNADFGRSVAIDGNTVISGARANVSVAGSGAGSVFVYQRNGTTWTETQKIFPADLHSGDAFGLTVDLSNSNAVIGSPGDAVGSINSQGSAYIFAPNPANCTFVLNPARSEFLPASSGADSFTVTTQAGCVWQATVQDNVAWATTTSAGTGIGTVNFNVAANAGKSRRAEITINGRQVFTVSQAGGSGSQPGDLDPNFGNAGLITTKVLNTNQTNGAAVQTDGKIVVVGGSFGSGSSQTSPSAAQVLRYNADGTLDTTFDVDGIATTSVLIASSVFFDVVIQPDGKIVVAGDYRFRVGQEDVMVLCFLGEELTIARTPFDFDGDGKADISVFRPSGGVWYSQQSQAGFSVSQVGAPTDRLVPADYDGDGKADVAVFRPLNGGWYLQRSQLGFTGFQFGLGTDLPTPADYDGDSRADIAVFRSGVWYLQPSTAGFTGVSFGGADDKPISNAYVR